MPLFENLPYTNFENINLDMILMDIKTMGQKYDELDGRLDELEASYTIINQNITNIQNELDEIDLSGLEGRLDVVEQDLSIAMDRELQLELRVSTLEETVSNQGTAITNNTTAITNNNIGSVNRDNALSARLSVLEAAKLHDVYNYYSDGNQCIFGSDLRKLPSACKTIDGYPLFWGNTQNRAENQTKTRAWKFTDDGMVPNTDSTDGYDYYQTGMVCSGLVLGNQYTVTFAVSSGGDATPTWYSHTFLASNESWTVATGCTIRYRNFLGWSGADDTYKTISFMGTPASWASFLGNNKIVYLYVEQGSGSVDTGATAKPKFTIKDRLPFLNDGEAPAPVIPAPTQYDFYRTQEITLSCVDPTTGTETTFTGDIRVYFYLWSFNGMLNGYAKVVFLTSNQLYTKLSQYSTSFTVLIDITNEGLTRQKHQVPMMDSNPIEGHYAKLTMLNGSGGTDPIEDARLQWESAPFTPSEVIENVGYVVANIPIINLIH